MNTNVDKKTKRPSFLIILALIILTTGAIFSLGGSLLMFGASLITMAFPSPFVENLFTTLSSTTMLAVFFCLTLPGIVFLVQKLLPNYQHKETAEQDPFNEMPFSRLLAPNLVLIATIFLLAITYLIATRFGFVRWLLPFLQIPAVIAPIFWVYQFATRDVYPRPAKRHWIAFGLDLTLQPILAILFELLIMLVMLVPVILWLALNPELLDNLLVLLQDLENVQTFTVEQIELLAASWLENPWVIFFILTFVAFFVPLLEELIKPILIWRWIKRPLTEMDGFWLGLIGGAAFTLYENFGNLSSMAMINDWYFLLLARLGTSLLHMGTSALMGWAMMKTFADRKLLRLLGIYTVSVLLHGGWNFFAILQGFVELPMQNPPAVFVLSPIALPVLILIATICGAILIFGARKIKNQQDQLLLKETSEVT